MDTIEKIASIIVLSIGISFPPIAFACYRDNICAPYTADVLLIIGLSLDVAIVGFSLLFWIYSCILRCNKPSAPGNHPPIHASMNFTKFHRKKRSQSV